MVRFWTIAFAAVALVAGGCERAAVTQPEAVPAPVAETVPATIEEAEAARAAGRVEVWEAALLRLADSGDPIVTRRALALLGVHYSETQNLQEARAALRRAAASWPELRPFLLLRLADVQRRLGSFGEAAATASSITQSYPDSTAAKSATLLLLGALGRIGTGSEIEQIAVAARLIPVDEMTEPEFASAADDLDAGGHAGLAGEFRLHLLSSYPGGRLTEETWRKVVTAEPSPLTTLDFPRSVKLAERLGRSNRYDQALDLIERIGARFPAQSRTPYLRYVRAQALFNSRNYERLIAEPSVPKESYYLAIELLRGRAQWRTGQNEAFVAALERIIAGFPSSKEAREAKLQLGKYYITDVIDYPKAIGYYRDAIAAGGSGSEGEHRWTLGWIQTLAGQDAEALATFARYVESHPDSDYTSNALFWSGKIAARQGDAAASRRFFERLIALYPYGYFSYRAREILGDAPRAPREIDGAPPFPDVSLDAAEETNARLAAVDDLMAIGMRREAARELKAIAAEKPDDKALAYRLADYYATAGEAFRAMGTLNRNFRDVVRHGARNVPQRFWEILYPRPYWDVFQREAERRKLEPYRLTAIARQESGFEPSVVSSAGAVGLMQIMPREAARIAAAGGIEGVVTRETLFDPSTNIAVGAAEFAQKLQRMDGNLVHAIASYNAGEDAVGRWIAKSTIDDVDMFIESIPYSETRLYVKNVTRNFFEYSRVYGTPAKEEPH